MGAIEVGAYIRFLANAQNIKLGDVAKAAGVQLKYFSALSRGEIVQPGVGVLRRMTERVNGSWQDIGDLIDMGSAGEAIGRQRAIEWAVQRKLIDLKDARIFETATREELAAAAAHLRELADRL